jgi:ABC-type dipeptide/oligopeptide/nickel transport system ATPase component
MKSGKPMIQAEKLVLSYELADGKSTEIGPVTFEIKNGEAVGLIGESGAGKSTLGFEILGLLPFKGGKRTSGSLDYEGMTCRDTAYIPQDPLSALDPLFSIGSQMREIDSSRENILDALRRAHLPLETMSLKSYPHELSGGMRQRVVIAMALLRRPRLLIADEPTSSLDMILQAGILELFRELHREGQSFLFITHHLPLAASFCERLLVMRDGKIVEEGAPKEIFEHPKHPYTRLLVEAVPELKK